MATPHYYWDPTPFHLPFTTFPYLFSSNDDGLLLSRGLLVQIIRKMKSRGFCRLIQSCKKANQFIEENKSDVKIYYRHFELWHGISKRNPECPYGSPCHHRCGAACAKVREPLAPKLAHTETSAGGSGAHWNPMLLEYFHFTCLQFLEPSIANYFADFLTHAEINGTRCFELLVAQKDALQDSVRIFKPKRLIMDYVVNPPFDNLANVPFIEINVQSFNTFPRSQPVNSRQYAEYLLQEAGKTYTGILYAKGTIFSKPEIWPAFCFCLQKMRTGEFTLTFQTMVQCNLVAETELQFWRHSKFSNIWEDDTGTITIFDADNEKFLVLFERKEVFRAKTLASWEEFCKEMKDFLAFSSNPHFEGVTEPPPRANQARLNDILMVFP